MTTTVGLKLTHDGAVAIFHGNSLLYSIEAEKLHNNPRYSKLSSSMLPDMLPEERLFIDGWKNNSVTDFALPVNSYHQFGVSEEVPKPFLSAMSSSFEGHVFTSYTHIAGHVVGAHMAHPTPNSVRSILVWDGGCPPILYSYDDAKREYEFKGMAHSLYGTVYSIAGYYFGPYNIRKQIDELFETNKAHSPLQYMQKYGSYEWPGKLMSWMGEGKVINILLAKMSHILKEVEAAHPFKCPKDYPPMLSTEEHSEVEHDFLWRLYMFTKGLPYSEADVFRSLHEFLGRKLLSSVLNLAERGKPLIFTGGSALNIKWNSMLRKLHGNVWVPPFCNDSGNAIGAAACGLRSEYSKIEWDVFCGPNIIYNFDPVKHDNWCEVYGDLNTKAAQHLASGGIVIRLYGRAEIGPRALGHRSILADPREAHMKHHLNMLKKREDWRPVAPIVLKEDYALHFEGGEDDDLYMLFDHKLHNQKLQALNHSDGTARVQVASEPSMIDLLKKFKALSSIGVLCNTSANFNGRGFFPDIESAILWVEDQAKADWKNSNDKDIFPSIAILTNTSLIIRDGNG